MKETITVHTGEIKTGVQTLDLRSSPLGSCVLFVLFDKKGNAGGMAHIMLPGKAPYKENVVPFFLRKEMSRKKNYIAF